MQKNKQKEFKRQIKKINIFLHITSTSSQTKQKQEEKKMSKDLRIGVVGVGAIGRTHIERINHQLQGGKVVACSDVNAEFGKQLQINMDVNFMRTEKK